MADGNARIATRLAAPTVFDIGWLSERMRPDEIAQWCAQTGNPDYDADLAARSVIATMGPFALCLLGPDNLPIAAAGFVEDRPGVFTAWMIGTPDGWEKHWRTITRHCRRCLDGLLETGRAHRVHTYALASRTQAHDWYARGLGMVREGVACRYFADGQDAVVFAKVREQS